MHVDRHFRRGVEISITTDASPWGLGGFLEVDGIALEYFAIPVTEMDAKHLGTAFVKDSTGQQAFEALAILVALRVWKYAWTNKRSCIRVASDNMASLAMVCRMQPHSPVLAVVARELALDISDSVYEPQLAEHIPGISNIVADMLSRKFDPEKKYTLPPLLAGCKQIHPEERRPAWWRAIRPRQRHGGE